MLVKHLSNIRDHLGSSRLRLYQMMNRLTGVESCLLFSLLQSKGRKHLDSCAVFPRHSSARPEWCSMWKTTETPESPCSVIHVITFALHRDVANLGQHHKTQKRTLILPIILQPVSHCDVSVGTMCWEFIGSWPNVNT